MLAVITARKDSRTLLLHFESVWYQLLVVYTYSRWAANSISILFFNSHLAAVLAP